MYKYLLIFLCLSGFLLGQDEIDCIEIDFESIPGEQTLFSGLEISEQYRDQFGIYFELENGGVPILADVGGDPATAFVSMWGNDTPAPGVDLGEFFLTDDGELSFSNLISPPIVIRFDVPVDTFSGCIMDMDFGETFVIHARDIDDNILLADTIRAGDPMTGDGQQTCWGFNLPDCSGTIYSIRYEGFRQTAGGFGMGIDNLTFCTGVDINALISTQTTQTACGDFESGTVIIEDTAEAGYQYAINGSAFQEEPFFTELPAGDHLVLILTDKGCIEPIPTFIDGPSNINFVEVDVFDTTCELDNGMLSITTSLTNNVSYSLDGINYQEEAVFESLASGNYTVYAQDAFGCVFEDFAYIEDSQLPSILSTETVIDQCEYGVGEITINAVPGSGGSLSYSLNDELYTDEEHFTGLSGNEYDVYIIDEDGCKDSIVSLVGATPGINNILLNSSQPFCDVALGVENNGSITVNATGGTGELSYVLNQGLPQTSLVFNALSQGDYEIVVTDELGCLLRANTSLDIPKCPVWIPNVFSPNNDSTNDFFNIATLDGYELGVIQYMIFDRWGEKVYESFNFEIGDLDKYWDGYFNGQKATEGVYAYLIQVSHPNEEIEYFTGDVTLVR